MKLYVYRRALKETYTIGTLYVNGDKFCDTLEDKDRGLEQSMSISKLKKLKIYGKTAIPTGTYDVKIYYWPKYRKNYPWLQNVPAYDGILIHSGTTADNSLGCILVGNNNAVGKLTDDGSTRKLTKLIDDAINRNESVEITIGYTKPITLKEAPKTIDEACKVDDHK